MIQTSAAGLSLISLAGLQELHNALLADGYRMGRVRTTQRARRGFYTLTVIYTAPKGAWVLRHRWKARG